MSTINTKNTTVIICCAGMGTRLGIGTTKALLDIDGVPLIIRQLELLKDFDDICIVAGFQAERLIRVVKDYRKDIMFAFNYQYETTGVADSLKKALIASREYVLNLDGDIVVNANDFITFNEEQKECIAISHITSEEPTMAVVDSGTVLKLSKSEGNMQWPGIFRVKSSRLIIKSSYVYDALNDLLPLPAFNLRSREINTQEDYENAIDWFKKGQVN